uniref:Uncharacterized protein n=1 Tax=Cucumis melo TaxID=3656 RepID=A0A9I9DKQ6_CUCME
MEKSAAAAAAILCLLLLSAEAVVTVSADAADCIDACFTACVQKDSEFKHFLSLNFLKLSPNFF